MIKTQLNKDNNLEVGLDIPPFVFKMFLKQNAELSYAEIWKKMLEKSPLNWIEPKEIGALTDAPIVMWNQSYFWFPSYEVDNEFEILYNGKTLVLEKIKCKVEV